MVVEKVKRYSTWLQGAYHVILSSHLHLLKACVLLKSCPHGFIWGEKTRDSTGNRRKNKKSGAWEREMEHGGVSVISPAESLN